MISAVTASQSYNLARLAIAPAASSGTDRFEQRPTAAAPNAGDRFLAALEGIDVAAQDAMTGKTGTQTLVQAIAESEAALETVVAIRDRVVEAYQEILRMPV